MKCPVCKDPNLAMTERQGVEIDYCPECRGIWLDRGELEKMIDRAEDEVSSRSASRGTPYRDDRYRDDDHYRHKGHHHKRKKSLLGELFDF